jgi:hypothetical protein
MDLSIAILGRELVRSGLQPRKGRDLPRGELMGAS